MAAVNSVALWNILRKIALKIRTQVSSWVSVYKGIPLCAHRVPLSVTQRDTVGCRQLLLHWDGDLASPESLNSGLLLGSELLSCRTVCRKASHSFGVCSEIDLVVLELTLLLSRKYRFLR